ncbi:MAG: hypothetical protein ACJ77H_01020, partial [Actinomycetota bacterium]
MDPVMDPESRAWVAALAGQDLDVQLPGRRAHPAGCLACREEHESLHALLAAEGGRPAPAGGTI